jgi:hypothetical protein
MRVLPVNSFRITTELRVRCTNHCIAAMLPLPGRRCRAKIARDVVSLQSRGCPLDDNAGMQYLTDDT